MLVEDRGTFSRSMIRNRLRDVLSHDEVEIDLLLGEVRRRHAAAPNVYPFKVIDNRIERVVPDATIYTHLLLLSLDEAPFRRQRGFASVDVGLDLLTIEGLIAYLGKGALGIRFAWPALKGPNHRPTGFADAIDWLADQLDRTPGTGRRSLKKKDGGVDVVVWRPFHDRGAGFLVILAQTTVQMNFVPKAKDIRAHQWNEWIPLGVPPLTAIVVPHSIPSTSDAWDDMHYDVNMIVDRMRLCELLENAAALPADVCGRLDDWNQAELAGLAL